MHPELGYVPSRSNTWFGFAVYVAVLGVVWWLLPTWLPWLVTALLVGLVVSAAVQALLGHRRRCWVRRTLRWTFGVIGALVDPVDQD